MQYNSGFTPAPARCGSGQLVLRTSSDTECASSSPPGPTWLDRSGTAKISRSPHPLQTLPTMLLFSMSHWLTDQDARQLIRSDHYLEREMQGFFRSQLRPSAQDCISPIVSYRNTANLLPVILGIDEEGESMFQSCLSLKKSSLSDVDYMQSVVEMFGKRVSGIESGEKLMNITAGTALSLGGTLIPEVNRDALLAAILATSTKKNHGQMGAMIFGLCLSFGGKDGRPADFKAVLDKILDFHTTPDPYKMGGMLQSLCHFLGGADMTPDKLRFVTAKILDACVTGTRQQTQAAIANLFLAVGGRKTAPAMRDYLMGQIFDRYATKQNLPLWALVRGICFGLGGPGMRRSDIDVVLERILGSSDSWSCLGMGWSIAAVCQELGGLKMTAEHRDVVLSAILGSGQTSSPAQMGRMIWAVVYVLGGQAFGAAHITETNLLAMIDAILNARTRCSTVQMSDMWCQLISGLGATDVSPAHRDLLLARFKESGCMAEMMASIKSGRSGQQLVSVLQPD